MCDKTPAFVMNTRIYSFLLIRNDIPYRWRGRYNEDTDLSLRVLKDGWCTVQFNAFLAGKCTTQKIKGGNTEEFYSKEGTYPKSKMLEDMHPDVAKVVWKFNRWHHHVDYSQFTQTLKLKDDIKRDYKVNNHNMIIIPTEEKNTFDSKSYLEEKYSDLVLEAFDDNLLECGKSLKQICSYIYVSNLNKDTEKRDLFSRYLLGKNISKKQIIYELTNVDKKNLPIKNEIDDLYNILNKMFNY